MRCVGLEDDRANGNARREQRESRRMRDPVCFRRGRKCLIYTLEELLPTYDELPIWTYRNGFEYGQFLRRYLRHHATLLICFANRSEGA